MGRVMVDSGVDMAEEARVGWEGGDRGRMCQWVYSLLEQKRQRGGVRGVKDEGG